MSVLKRLSRKRDDLFLGGYLPKDLVTFFSLYCLSKGISKTTLLKRLITDLEKEVENSGGLDAIKRKIADKLYLNWADARQEESEMDWDVYQAYLEKDFRKNNLDEYFEEIMMYATRRKKAENKD